MQKIGHDSLKTLSTLVVDGQSYQYFSFEKAQKHLPDFASLPISLKILLENLLRYEDGKTVTVEDIHELADWATQRKSSREIAFMPTRVLMQDFTGVPAIVDLAAMRDAMQKSGYNPAMINPLSPVDLVIDHSVMVDSYASTGSFDHNVTLELQRNKERYAFLKWGQKSFNNFRVVPPGTGICHQVNLEYLAQTVWTHRHEDKLYAYPDTLVGTDSHTTMVNALAVLGWGVGGIEAEAAMLGQPISMIIPEVVGFKLTGALREGATATDLVLTITQMLRSHGVVGKFVEFFGEGLNELNVADRATIANMAPEYGATCGFFPIDQETLNYLAFTGRDKACVHLVEAYAKAQGLWRDDQNPPVFTDILTLDLSKVESTLAGPKKPQTKVLLSEAAQSCQHILNNEGNDQKSAELHLNGQSLTLKDGAVVIAAITSCTNTSNPSVMVGAGLLAQKALSKGLTVKPWVKTSLAPGSQVVTDYLKKAGLDQALDAIGFNLVGYGCTTCIGNSGPLLPEIAAAIDQYDLTVAGVLSGNRNFEGRIHPQVKLNYLGSPLLVVAYAFAGTILHDMYNDALGYDKEGKPVFLRDIWPSNEEIQSTIERSLTSSMFKERYKDVFKGDAHWSNLDVGEGVTYAWSDQSTYVKLPPYFDEFRANPKPIQNIIGAKVLALLGDSITTDHISPAGSIKTESPAGAYLLNHQIDSTDFNSYGSRRGNHEVMMRGTFANIRLKNEMTPEKSGGYTRHIPSGAVMSIYDAAMKYQEENTPLVVIAGKEYGTGSSRDWAAKGTYLLGVRALIAESFERIHRSNLIGMGVLPLQFMDGETRETLALTGDEIFDIHGLDSDLKPGCSLNCTITSLNGHKKVIILKSRIDTEEEREYFLNGGILPYVMRNIMKHSA